VEIIKRCDSFTEYSPSGKGVHIYVAGKSETNKFDPIGVEIYCGGQYFTVTGKHYAGTPLEVREISADTLALAARDDRRREGSGAKAKAAAAAAAPRAGEASARVDRRRLQARVNDAAMRTCTHGCRRSARRRGRITKGYRVSSRDLGRELEEDLSITAEGIVDWGVHDQGDAREGRRTPIDLVMEWSSTRSRPRRCTGSPIKLGIDVGQPRTPQRGAMQPDGPPGG
jgi:putative DNA primase/helicase